LNKCLICGKEFEPVDKFHPNQKYCSKECHRVAKAQSQRRRYRENPEHFREIQRRYRQRHYEEEKEKTREYNARKHHTNAISLTGVCIRCGKTFPTSNLKNRTFRHHIIPKEYEIHSEENLIELCNHCHASLHRFQEKLLWKLVPHKKIVEEIERFLDLDLSSLKQLL